jgi:Kae1-associated kinase Bud32
MSGGDVIGIGAEARITSGTFLGYPVISKHRFEKKYRAAGIDQILRKNRTIQETRLLMKARELGVNTPFVLDVDKTIWTIIMLKVDGEAMKHHMGHQNMISHFRQIGSAVGLLHEGKIIHGDLTTSNIILSPKEEIWFIDFGLGFVSGHIEDQAVDILVLKHILESSHPSQAEQAFSSFMEGYNSYIKSKQVLKRMSVVESRVRYRKH